MLNCRVPGTPAGTMGPGDAHRAPARTDPEAVRGDTPPELARGHAPHRWRPVRLHVPQSPPLPVAVVLGLLLHGGVMGALRPRPLASRARVAAGGSARRRLHRPHDLLEHAAAGPPALHLQRGRAG